MERGISPGEPGWYFVPFVSALAAPLMLLILAAALAYEIAIRLAGWATGSRAWGR